MSSKVRPYTEEQKEHVREYVAALPESLQEHLEDFLHFRMTVEEVRMFVETAKRSGDPWWVDAVDRDVVAELDACVGNISDYSNIAPGKAHVTTVKVRLTENDKAELRSEFSCVTDLRFENDESARRVEHAFMNAIRHISRVLANRYIPRGAFVAEIGAKAEHAVLFGAVPGRYMGIMPVLDAHDLQRHSSAGRNIQLMLSRRGRTALKPAQRLAAETYVNRFDSMFTRKKVQELTIRADVIIAHDSLYDIPLADAVDFTHRSGAKMLIGTMVRCAEGAIYQGRAEGSLPVGGFRWVADAEKDSIKFNFRSSSFPYSHKLSIFREYQNCNGRVFRYRDAQYVYKFLPMSTRTQLFVAVVRIDDRDYPQHPRRYAPTGQEGMLRIYHPSAELGPRSKLRGSFFEIPQDVFSRVLSDRLVAKNEADHDVIRSIRAARVSVLVNGQRVSTAEPIGYDIVKSLASVVQVVAADMKRNGTKMTAEAEAAILAGGYKRQGLVSALCDTVYNTVAAPGSYVSLVLERIRKLGLEAAGPPVKIEQCEAFRRLPDREIVYCDGTAAFVPSQCYCEEKTALRATLRGERGGLTEDEVKVLEAYARRLDLMACEHCCFPDDLILEAETAPAERKKSVSDDSGYSTAGGSETSPSAATESGTSDETSEAESEADDDDFYDAVEGIVGGQQVILNGEGPVRDALEEYAEICQLQMDSAHSIAEEWCKILLRGGIEPAVISGASDGRTDHYLLKVGAGYVTGKIGDGPDGPQDFKRVYDFGRRKWLDVMRMPNGQAMLPVDCSELVYTNSSFLIWNQPALLSGAQRLLGDPLLGPMLEKVRMVNGIYGCGKTRSIIQKYRAGAMCMTSTKSGAIELRRGLYPGGARAGYEWVRTYDSALINGTTSGVSTLYLDEMPMSHFGQVAGLIHQINPRTVIALGDFMQITYIPFLAGFRPRFAGAEEFCEIEPMPVTHRCRLSVVAATYGFYPSEFKISCCVCCKHVTDTEEGGPWLKKVDSINQIPMARTQSGKKVKYVTFTKDDKDKLQKALVTAGVLPAHSAGEPYDHVSTVHEVQGGTFEWVLLVRLETRSKKNTIFYWPKHINTGVSRAMFGTEYYTLSDEEDGIVQACRDAASERIREIIRRNRREHFPGWEE